jgi:predicted DNA-binding transcriptional regulator AlpA
MSASNAATELPAEGFVRISTVLRVFPVSRAIWYEGIKAGRFPKPVKLNNSSKIAAWRVADIRELIERTSGQAGGSHE